MSDLEKLKATFDEVGVEYFVVTAREDRGEDINTITMYADSVTWDTSVRVPEGIGYGSFYCDFYFLDGKYQKQGVWE